LTQPNPGWSSFSKRPFIPARWWASWAPGGAAGARRDLVLLAWGHGFRKDQSYTIFDCAQLLVDLGAKAVLLMDEGRDVFQHVFDDYSDLRSYERRPRDFRPFPVPADREQIRATLAFWVENGRGNGR
jgi:hypothetical protein